MQRVHCRPPYLVQRSRLLWLLRQKLADLCMRSQTLMCISDQRNDLNALAASISGLLVVPTQPSGFSQVRHRACALLSRRSLATFFFSPFPSNSIYRFQGGGFRIVESENVTVEGITIDYDPLPYTQATIIAMKEASVIGRTITFAYALLPNVRSIYCLAAWVHRALPNCVPSATPYMRTAPCVTR